MSYQISHTFGEITTANYFDLLLDWFMLSVAFGANEAIDSRLKRMPDSSIRELLFRLGMDAYGFDQSGNFITPKDGLADLFKRVLTLKVKPAIPAPQPQGENT